MDKTKHCPSQTTNTHPHFKFNQPTIGSGQSPKVTSGNFQISM